MLERVFRDSRVSKASSLLTYDACVTWDSEPAGMPAAPLAASSVRIVAQEKNGQHRMKNESPSTKG